MAYDSGVKATNFSVVKQRYIWPITGFTGNRPSLRFIVGVFWSISELPFQTIGGEISAGAGMGDRSLPISISLRSL